MQYEEDHQLQKKNIFKAAPVVENSLKHEEKYDIKKNILLRVINS